MLKFIFHKQVYYSQYLQDVFVQFVFFNNKKDGYFIDIGAYDGIRLSNTYLFEKNKNWKGICVEPNNKVFNK